MAEKQCKAESLVVARKISFANIAAQKSKAMVILITAPSVFGANMLILTQGTGFTLAMD